MSGGDAGGSSGDREVEFSAAKSDIAGALSVATKGLVSKAVPAPRVYYRSASDYASSQALQFVAARGTGSNGPPG